MTAFAWQSLPLGGFLVNRPAGPPALRGVASALGAAPIPAVGDALPPGQPAEGNPVAALVGLIAVCYVLSGVRWKRLFRAPRKRRAGPKRSRVQGLALGDDAGVEDYVKEHDIVAFVMPPCPFCERAVNVLKEGALEVTTVEAPEGSKLREELRKITGSSSVPKVWVKGQFVGGCNDGGLGGVVPLMRQGKIKEMLGS